VEPAAHLDAIRQESARLLAAAESAGLDAAVPSCPDWTVADLLAHVGRVQRWQADIVHRRVAAAEFSFDDAPADADALVGWVREATERLPDVLGATPAGATMWTLAGPGTAAFWFRRQAHEVAVHRVDAELASGNASPVDAELARDGIDEFMTVLLGGRLRERFTGAGETVHLHCTDGEGEWLVRLTPGGPEVERSHAKGDVAARGPASDLLLVLWRRAAPSAVEVFGDEALLERFLHLARI